VQICRQSMHQLVWEVRRWPLSVWITLQRGLLHGRKRIAISSTIARGVTELVDLIRAKIEICGRHLGAQLGAVYGVNRTKFSCAGGAAPARKCTWTCPISRPRRSRSLSRSCLHPCKARSRRPQVSERDCRPGGPARSRIWQGGGLRHPAR
jgi:hypothetical protein